MIGEGQITVEASEFSLNSALSGGAVYGGANVMVGTTTMHNNVAEAIGGAIASNDDVFVYSSALYDNEATGGSGESPAGGAIYAGGGVRTLSSTFARNQAAEGGAIFAYTEAVAALTTFVDNQATSSGGHIWVAQGLSLSSSVLNLTEGAIAPGCRAHVTSMSAGSVTADPSCSSSGTASVTDLPLDSFERGAYRPALPWPLRTARTALPARSNGRTSR